MPWAKTSPPNILHYGLDLHGQITLLLKLLEVLFANNINKNMALEDGISEILVIIILAVDPNRRDN